LLKIKVLAISVFEEAPGFLRILNGKEAIGNSGVHPESYDLLNMAAHLS